MGSRYQPADITVAMPVFGQQGKVIAVLDGYLRADNTVESQRFRQMGKAHRPAEVIMVGDSHGTIVQLHCTKHKLLQRGCTVVKGVVAVTVKLGVVHGKYAVSIRLAVPVALDKVFVDDHSLPVSEADCIVKTRNRLGTPPLIVEAPEVINTFYTHLPFSPYYRRMAFGIFLHPQPVRCIQGFAGGTST